MDDTSEKDSPYCGTYIFEAIVRGTQLVIIRSIEHYLITFGEQEIIKPELQDIVSTAKTSFAEVLPSLDLFEDYIKEPKEETAEELKQLLHRLKKACKVPIKTDNIDEILFLFRTFLVENVSDNKNKKKIDSLPHRTRKENLDNADANHLSSTTPSISEEAAKLDLQNFKPNDLQSFSKEKQRQEKHQYDPIQKNEPEKYNLAILSPYESKSLNHDSDKGLTSNATHRPLGKVKGKGKKVERKLHSKSFGIPDEEVEYEIQETPRALKKEVRMLRVENQELLAELGRVIVENTAKEREARKSELFQRIYRPLSPEAKESVVCTYGDKAATKDDKLGYPNDKETALQESSNLNENASGNGFTKPRATNENHASVQGAESLVKNDHQPGKEEMVKNDKDERNLHDRAGMSVIASKKTSGGERMDQSGSVSGASNAASTSREGNIDQTSTEQSYESLSFSVQQDYSNEKEKISLSNVPPTSVATTLYNNYKLLLLSLGQMLLSSDVAKLMSWATQNFPIVNPENATHVLFQLDESGVINATDLSQLRHFFESTVRFDLVYIIDAFLLGDYAILRQIPASKKRDARTTQNLQHGTATRNSNIFNAASTSQFPLRGSSARAESINEPPSSIIQLKQQAFPSLFSKHHTSNGAKFVARSPNENQSTTYQQQHVKSGGTGSTESNLVVGNGPGTNEGRRTTGNSSTNSSATIGSNGSRLSKFQRNREQSDNWLCSHYKRHCYVKFECCDQFWPCHRCHNNQSTCGRKKLKSRDTQMVKCAYCNKEQQFGEKCCDCGAKFASYYCGKCKHLTGTDDHPYHCEKCGICRIHGDRSFHCDICGVCLDVQLRGNHKCREGSAHDECCICLEDAFTGCQILPCSHKVHKECATQMIRSGITRCPICRESFAHKLERRALPNSRKRSGK